MQRAENEGLDLEQKLTLRAADYVDGTGDLLWVDPGARYSLKELNRRSIVDSDSTATDMLIRFLGEKSFGEDVARLVPEGLGPITTILQVRYDAYREVHPSVSVLTNRDFIDLKTARTYQARYDMLLEKLNITAREADAKGVREAFERYYQRGINSGSLEAFGALLEQLVRGELLNDAHTDQLLGYLSEITTKPAPRWPAPAISACSTPRHPMKRLSSRFAHAIMQPCRKRKEPIRRLARRCMSRG